MKQYILEFLKRGLMVSVGGPVVLAIVYGILGATGTVLSFTPREVVMGIFSSALLAFIAAGITVVYQIERLPLFAAVLIHGVALYADYILIYLLNGWLKSQIIPIAIFTAAFVVGYAVIWLCIYKATQSETKQLNAKLNKVQ